MAIFFFLIIGLVMGFIMGLFYGRRITKRERRWQPDIIRLARTVQSC
jgi:uncharacterized protein YneF (UPF0154 family)